MSATWKAQQRLKEHNRKVREKKAMRPKPADGTAEANRRAKLKEGKLKRPGFGSSRPSVSDHLNEVVFGRTSQKTMRELRDERIEAESKQRKLKPRPGGGSRVAHGGGHTLGGSTAPPTRMTERCPAGQSLVLQSMLGKASGSNVNSRAPPRSSEALVSAKGARGNVWRLKDASGGNRLGGMGGASKRGASQGELREMRARAAEARFAALKEQSTEC